MADRKASNRYYPPEFWDQPNFNDKANLNTFRGESWRNRGAQVNSKLLTQGRDVIRFETPFNIWCEKCGEVIHKGVRFNADKHKIGKYFTTTIWEFHMKCHLCDNKLVIKTDPQNTTFVCVSGCRKKEESWEQDEDTTIGLDDKEKRKLEEDPFYRLEHFADKAGTGKTEDQVKAKSSASALYELKELASVRSRDDGLLNRKLRKAFRGEKKEEKLQAEADAAERKRLNMSIPLLPPSEEDAKAAKAQMFGERISSEHDRYKEARKESRQRILQSPLLPQVTSTRPMPCKFLIFLPYEFRSSTFIILRQQTPDSKQALMVGRGLNPIQRIQQIALQRSKNKAISKSSTTAGSSSSKMIAKAAALRKKDTK